MFKGFKTFIARGNVVDMAVGIIIGAAFGKIVTSFVNDILMPPIGILIGNVNFSKLSIVLKHKTATSAAVTINYGAFINTLIDFLIIGFAIYILVQQVNRIMPKKPNKTKDCPRCCSSIPKAATRCAYCTSDI